MITAPRPVGTHLREWRQRRRMSQLDLALEAEISARHLSFVETGRSVPSREMLLHLAEQLAIPLRERNLLLVSAGFAPIFSERPLGDPAMDAARQAVDLVLKGHEPYPAVAIDRHWTLIASNAAVGPLLAGLAPDVLRPPVNVLRLSLHPDGLAPRIANLREWREHLLARLRHQIDLTADPVLIDLLHELTALPVSAPKRSQPREAGKDYGDVVVPMQLATEAGPLNLFSTTTVFGTPVDVTLAELAIEAFFPADAETGQRLRALQALA